MIYQLFLFILLYSGTDHILSMVFKYNAIIVLCTKKILRPKAHIFKIFYGLYNVERITSNVQITRIYYKLKVNKTTSIYKGADVMKWSHTIYKQYWLLIVLCVWHAPILFIQPYTHTRIRRIQDERKKKKCVKKEQMSQFFFFV